MSIFCSSVAEGVSSQSLVPQIEWIMWDPWGEATAGQCSGVPGFITTEHGWAKSGIVHLAAFLRWKVSGDKDRQEFPEPSSGHTTFGSNGTLTALPIVTKKAKSGLDSNYGAIEIYFSHSSAFDGHALPLHLVQT